METSRVRLHLWPETYVVARLAALPATLPDSPRDGAPWCLVVGHDEVSVLAPESLVERLEVEVEHVSGGWRALTLDAVFPHDVVGVLARLTDVLARIAVPVMTFSSHDTDHLLVPAAQLGRALAALNHLDLDRLLPVG